MVAGHRSRQYALSSGLSSEAAAWLAVGRKWNALRAREHRPTRPPAAPSLPRPFISHPVPPEHQGRPTRHAIRSSAGRSGKALLSTSVASAFPPSLSLSGRPVGSGLGGRLEPAAGRARRGVSQPGPYRSTEARRAAERTCASSLLAPAPLVVSRRLRQRLLHLLKQRVERALLDDLLALGTGPGLLGREVDRLRLVGREVGRERARERRRRGRGGGRRELLDGGERGRLVLWASRWTGEGTRARRQRLESPSREQ